MKDLNSRWEGLMCSGKSCVSEMTILTLGVFVIMQIHKLKQSGVESCLKPYYFESLAMLNVSLEHCSSTYLHFALGKYIECKISWKANMQLDFLFSSFFFWDHVYRNSFGTSSVVGVDLLKVWSSTPTMCTNYDADTCRHKLSSNWQ